MIRTDVEGYAGIHVGDTVMVEKDSGFSAGKRLVKVVKEILVIDWTAEQSAKQGVPAREVVWTFTDGSTAGCHDRIAAKRQGE